MNSFAVAVSGGPDSLALAFLSKIYAIQNGLKVNIFIVDHKLRNTPQRGSICQKIIKKIL